MSALNIFLGKIQVSGLGQGFSESYWLKAVTLTAAKTALTALVNARKALLSSILFIEYANVSQLGVSRDSYIVISAPTMGSDTVVANIPNRLNDAILIRQESVGGRICNRYLHGVPDPAAVGGNYLVGAVAAWDTLLATYITALGTNSGFLNKHASNDPTTWTVDDWGTIVPRGLTDHKVGRPFGQQAGKRPMV